MNDSARKGALVFVCAVAGALSVVQLQSCTPEQQARTARAAEDLCAIHAAQRMLQTVYPELIPPPGSLREAAAAAADAFCVARESSSPPAGSEPLPSPPVPDAATQ